MVVQVKKTPRGSPTRVYLRPLHQGSRDHLSLQLRENFPAKGGRGRRELQRKEFNRPTSWKCARKQGTTTTISKTTEATTSTSTMQYDLWHRWVPVHRFLGLEKAFDKRKCIESLSGAVPEKEWHVLVRSNSFEEEMKTLVWTAASERHEDSKRFYLCFPTIHSFLWWDGSREQKRTLILKNNQRM